MAQVNKSDSSRVNRQLYLCTNSQSRKSGGQMKDHRAFRSLWGISVLRLSPKTCPWRTTDPRKWRQIGRTVELKRVAIRFGAESGKMLWRKIMSWYSEAKVRNLLNDPMAKYTARMALLVIPSAPFFKPSTRHTCGGDKWLLRFHSLLDPESPEGLNSYSRSGFRARIITTL